MNHSCASELSRVTQRYPSAMSVSVRGTPSRCPDRLDRGLLGVDPRLPRRIKAVQCCVAHRLNHIGRIGATP